MVLKLIPALSHYVAPAPVSVLSGVIMRNQSVREGYHAEGTMWYVPNYANVVKKATTVRTLYNQ